jgi:hypothetical protein
MLLPIITAEATEKLELHNWTYERMKKTLSSRPI